MREKTSRRGRESGPGLDPDEGDQSSDPASGARNIVLRLLAASPRTRSQLSQALARRGVPETIAEQVLDRFEELGLVNDTEFALTWVASRHRHRGTSRRLLARELRERGVAPEVIEQAVATLGAEDESGAAIELARKALRSSRSLDPERRQRRIMGMLARRGHSADVAFRAWRTVCDEDADTDRDLSWDDESSGPPLGGDML